MNQSRESRFLEALVDPPLDLTERLERASDDSIWMMGTGLRRLENAFLNGPASFDQLHVCDPSRGNSRAGEDPKPEASRTVRRYDDRCLERLGAFQQGTFDVCIACWMIGTIPVTDTLSLLYRTLSGGGQIGLIAMKEGSPELPLRLLRTSVREVTGKSVDFQSRGQLTGTETLRSLMTSLGYGEERVWNGDLEISFRSTEEVYRVLQHSAGMSLQEQLGDDAAAVGRVFCEKLEENRGSDPSISYEYLGATARSRG